MKTKIILFAASLALLILACSSRGKKETTNRSSTNGLQASMLDLKNSLETLLPSLIDQKSFEDAAQKDKVKTEINHLSEIASQVSHSPLKDKGDPSFAFLSEGFSAEIQRANEAFNLGKIEYARYSLMNVTSYCIECHTRTSSGPAFTNGDFDQKLGQLRPLERGEFLLATRRYDAALVEFMKVINSPSKNFQFIEFDRALRYALATTVKYKNDPTATEKIIHELRKAPQIPYYLKQASLTWSQSVNEWKEEIKKRKANPSLSQQLNGAEALIKKGRQAQVGGSDRGGDVDLLRGLAKLHHLLLSPLDKNQMGQALFLTGQAYEALWDLALWSIHENYFETCVRRVPHSSWAMKCFQSLQQSLVIGFTGSAGTQLPEDVQKRLAELETLAKPEASSQ